MARRSAVKDNYIILFLCIILIFKFMKKNRKQAFFSRLTNLKRGKRRIGLLGLFVILWMPLISMGQSQKVTILVNKVDVRVVFKSIKEQTGLNFMYNAEELKVINPVSLELKNVTVDSVMNRLLAGTRFAYVYENNAIVISKGKPGVQKQDFYTGEVKDMEGNPLPGVTVLLKGTIIGTSTDMNGRFKFPAAKVENSVLVFSFIGMKPVEQVVKPNVPVLIKMEDEAQAVGEVVVTGYFDKSRKSFSGAVTQMKREELRKFGNVNLISALALVEPSFKIKENNEQGSNPNVLPDFFIRGEGSFMGDSNLPTFIVDGYEVDRQYIFDMDIDRIESITILKDASATVFYGSRAANGVVVIETRRPEKGKFSVAYSNRTSLSVTDLTDYNLMNAAEKFEFECRAGMYDDEKAIKKEPIKQNLAKGVDTDWLSQPIRNALSHSHSLFLSGGDDVVLYGIGANYAQNEGVMKNSSRERYGVSFDLSYRKQNKISIRNSFSFNNTKAKNSPYGSFSLYAKANPYNPIRDDEGNIIKNYLEYFGETTAEPWFLNPLYDASLPYKNTEEYQNFTENLSVDYYFSPRLRLKGEFSFKKDLENKEEFLSPNHTTFSTVVSPNEKGRYSVENGKGFSYNVNLVLTYNTTIGKHFLSGGAAMNLLENKTSSNKYVVQGFLNENYNDIVFAVQYATDTKPYSNKRQNRMIGLLGNLNYMYDNRYFSDFSIRTDGSSNYGANSKWATLWSIGIGWNLNNEVFMKNCGWIEMLRIRASLGITGNQSFDPNIAQTMFRLESSEYYMTGLGTTFIQYGNKNLKWQKSYKRNVGIDLDIIKRRFSFRFDYYDDETSGLLLPVTVAPSLGFSQYTENFGKAKNQGYEFSVQAVIVRNRDYDWAVNFSGTHNKNRIVKISNALAALNEENNSDEAQFTKPISMYEEGESLSAIKAVPSLGINPQTGNELFLTRDGRITETWDYKDKVLVGDSQSKLQGSFGTNFMWKGLSLNMLFSYGWGGQCYNTTLAERVEGADPRANADKRVLDERWKEMGDHSFYKNIAHRNVSNVTSRFVQDNNYLEMSNLSIAYNLNGEWIKRKGVNNVRIGLNTSNLFHVSSIKRERGLDYPFARMYTFSLNINF